VQCGLVSGSTIARVALLALLACGKSLGTADGGGCSGRGTQDAATPEPEPLPLAPAPRGPGKPRGPITTQSDAVRLFRAAWAEEIIVPSKTHRSRGKYHTNTVLDGGAPFVERTKCRTAQELAIHDVAALPDYEELILFASRGALDREGDCWQVTAHDMSGEYRGYLDATTGALLYALVRPEG
jgi:hypothetical protein